MIDTALGLLLLALMAAPAHAHPGRLDATGCHTVHQRWVSADGKIVLEPGSRHCHHGLGKLKLDGSEMLGDPKATEEPPDTGGHRAREERPTR